MPWTCPHRLPACVARLRKPGRRVLAPPVGRVPISRPGGASNRWLRQLCLRSCAFSPKISLAISDAVSDAVGWRPRLAPGSGPLRLFAFAYGGRSSSSSSDPLASLFKVRAAVGEKSQNLIKLFCPKLNQPKTAEVSLVKSRQVKLSHASPHFRARLAFTRDTSSRTECLWSSRVSLTVEGLKRSIFGLATFKGCLGTYLGRAWRMLSMFLLGRLSCGHPKHSIFDAGPQK